MYTIAAVKSRRKIIVGIFQQVGKVNEAYALTIVFHYIILHGEVKRVNAAVLGKPQAVYRRYGTDIHVSTRVFQSIVDYLAVVLAVFLGGGHIDIIHSH